jgi:hypothetical protein
VVNSAFPLWLHEPFVPPQSNRKGRGTAGAIITIGNGVDYLLTAAHVPFYTLSNDYDAPGKENLGRWTEDFNTHCHFASYSRTASYDNDYAMIRCATEFRHLREGRVGIKDDDDQEIYVFGSLTTQFAPLLKEIADGSLLGPSRQTLVMKLGITTGLTFGTLLDFYATGTLRVSGICNCKFSDSGDSGSLVFFQFEGNFYPLGVLYCGGDGFSFVIPIWRILHHFCDKNGIDNVKFRVENPRVAGMIEFSKDGLEELEALVKGGNRQLVVYKKPTV